MCTINVVLARLQVRKGVENGRVEGRDAAQVLQAQYTYRPDVNVTVGDGARRLLGVQTEGAGQTW